MRALARGSVVVVLALAVLPWGAPEHSTHSPVGPQVGPSVAGTGSARSFAMHAPAIGRGAFDASRHSVPASSATPLESGKHTARMSDVTASSTADSARGVSGDGTTRARMPLARPHSPSRASVIVSDEFTDTAGPLARLYFA